MRKMNPIALESASEAAKLTMEMVSKKLGRVPNMYQVMANSPAVLEAYVKYNGALAMGTLGSKMGELIALATAESNNCSYCLSAHSFFGKKIGLSEEEILEGRNFISNDVKMNEGLAFAKKMLETPTLISSNDLEPLRKSHFSDGEILEIVAHVVRNIFTNYINIIAETNVDWPEIVVSLKVK